MDSIYNYREVFGSEKKESVLLLLFFNFSSFNTLDLRCISLTENDLVFLVLLMQFFDFGGC